MVETRKSRSLLAPTKPISQIDIAKIKEALEQAEKAPPTAQTSSDAQTQGTEQTKPSESTPTAEPQKQEETAPTPTTP